MKFLIVGDPHGDKKIFDIKINDEIDAIIITGDLGKSDLQRKYHFEYSIKKGIENWKDLISKDELKKIYTETINSSIEILKYFASKKPTFFVLGNLREKRTKSIKDAEKKYNISLPKFEQEIKKIKNIKNISFKKINFRGVEIVGIPYFNSIDWIEEFSPENKKLTEYAKKEEPEAINFLKKLPKVDILVSHIPPHGILDRIDSPFVPKDWIGKHAGSKLILNYVEKKQPRFVICGHIHESKGEEKLGQTRIINAGSSGDYQIIEI